MKNRKQLKKLKRIRINNKKLIKKYPFMRALDWWGKPIKTYDFTEYDEIPRGWRIAFGDILLEDMKNAANGKPIIIQQIKEKFGELRIYMAAPQEVHDVVNAYSELSGNICIYCGKPDVPMMDKLGWISPFCEKCFYKCVRTTLTYEQTRGTEDKMPNEIKFSRYENGEWVPTTIDIKPYADKIRSRYKV